MPEAQDAHQEAEGDTHHEEGLIRASPLRDCLGDRLGERAIGPFFASAISIASNLSQQMHFNSVRLGTAVLVRSYA
jgi:hypothetical protein